MPTASVNQNSSLDVKDYRKVLKYLYFYKPQTQENEQAMGCGIEDPLSSIRDFEDKFLHIQIHPKI